MNKNDLKFVAEKARAAHQANRAALIEAAELIELHWFQGILDLDTAEELRKRAGQRRQTRENAWKHAKLLVETSRC